MKHGVDCAIQRFCVDVMSFQKAAVAKADEEDSNDSKNGRQVTDVYCRVDSVEY